MPTVLTIAGSDSSGGAGIQADLRTFAALGVRGVTAITAITAQNDRGVSAVHVLAADLVTAQIEAVAGGARTGGAGPGATKIGMLGNAAVAEAVAAAIEELELPLVVLDPVLASTSGTRLLDDDGVQTVLLELMPKVFVVTPNIPEAEALSGVRITSPASARRAAERLHQIGAGNVIIKGGHGAVPLNDDRGELTITDLLFDGSDFHELTERRSAGGSIRGTGCSHSAALAASLASGRGLRDSARDAQRHVARLIADAASR